ncbi:MAG: serine/threonine-protein kinase [Planctomycetota bacterium]|jgi:serine/threonine-protein kinase
MTSTGPYTSSGSRGGLEFLQGRVARFGIVAAGLFALGLVARVAIELARGRPDVLISPAVHFHLVAVLIFVAIWAFCSGELRSFRFVRSVEGWGLLLACAALLAMGVYDPPAYRSEAILTLALTEGLVARVVFVPSTAKRTLMLASALGVALVASVYLTRVYARGAAVSAAVVSSAVTAAWWTVTTIVCVAASRVIYGLRKQVTDAQQLGQYTLEEKLGEGAMGVVYRARHAMLARPTAVKLLLPERFGETDLLRFEREVQLTAQLTHPHTVTIFDYGRTPEGIFYYAMELLTGAALDRIVEVDGPQPPERVAYIMDQVAAALSEAHDLGMIHRDIKPANIILTQQGGEPDVAKVVDFGLVKDVRGGAHDPSLSSVGAVAGTPFYMSPETILAYQKVDARSDLYALGAVAYFLLTGEPVFKGRDAGEVCTHHVQTQPTPPSKRVDTPVPAALESIVLACLEKDPDNRPASAGHLRARLWAGGSLSGWNTDRARRWWRLHGDKVQERRTVPEEAGRTIAVDLKKHKL